MLDGLIIGTSNGTTGTNISTNGNIGINGTIGYRETFRVLWLPKVPMVPLVKFSDKRIL